MCSSISSASVSLLAKTLVADASEWVGRENELCQGLDLPLWTFGEAFVASSTLAEIIPPIRH